MKSNVRFCLAVTLLSVAACVLLSACASGPQTRKFSGQPAQTQIVCDRESGKLIGLRGAPYPSACPLDLKSEFSRGYQKGREQSDYKVDWREVSAPKRDTQFRAFRTGYLEDQKGSCVQNSDCRIETSCNQGRCESSGLNCASSLDCVIQGHCIVDHCAAPR